MRKKKLFSIAYILIGQMVFSQNFQNIPLTLPVILIIEKQNNGIPTDTIDSFGILKNPHFDLYTLTDTKVYIFKRNNDDFKPSLHVWYPFSKDTHKLVGIKYNWGLFNPSFNPSKNSDMLLEISRNEKPFTKKYKSLRKQLNSEYGNSIKEKTIRDDKEVLIQNVFWEDDDKRITLSIRFDRLLTEIPGLGPTANPHIEIGLTWK